MESRNACYQPCSGDCRRRSYRTDVGRRARAGGRRRSHCRASSQPGPRRNSRGRPAFALHRSSRSARNCRAISCAGAGASRCGIRPDPPRHQRFPDTTTTISSRWRKTTSSASWPSGSAGWRSLDYRGREVTGFAQDDSGVDVELSDGQRLRAEYLRGLRRWPQPGSQVSGHRLSRVGCDNELADRRG